MWWQSLPAQRRGSSIDSMKSEVDTEAIRQRAYELAQLHPDATSEENWLLAEAELEVKRRDAESSDAEDAANLRAKIDMSVYGHP